MVALPKMPIVDLKNVNITKMTQYRIKVEVVVKEVNFYIYFSRNNKVGKYPINDGIGIYFVGIWWYSTTLNDSSLSKLGSDKMQVNYKKLWKLLIDRNMRKQDLKEKAGISKGTITKLGKNQNVSTETLAKICTALGCNIEDIVEFSSEE